MAYIRNHFYVPDYNPISVITQLIPGRRSSIDDRLVMILTNYDTEYEIEFESMKGVKILSEALAELLKEEANNSTDIKTFVLNNNSEF